MSAPNGKRPKDMSDLELAADLEKIGRRPFTYKAWSFDRSDAVVLLEAAARLKLLHEPEVPE